MQSNTESCIKALTPEQIFRQVLKDRKSQQTSEDCYLDLEPIFYDPKLNRLAYNEMKALFDKSQYDTIVAPDRAFAAPLGYTLALEQGKSFVPAYRISHMPYGMLDQMYFFGHDDNAVAIYDGRLGAENKVLIVADVLKTRRMVHNIIRSIGSTGAKVIGIAAFVDLSYVAARASISTNIPIKSVLWLE